MKNFKFYITVLFLSVFIISCDEDILDSPPLSMVTTDSYYKTPEEAEIALTGVYHILSATAVQNFGNNSTFSRSLMVMLNGATDEVLAVNNQFEPEHRVWGNGTFTAQSNFVNETWVFLYSGISRANYLIDRIEAIEGFTGNRKNEIIAEARFMRGFYHMILSMMHGGIPVYDGVGQDITKPRSTIQEVYDLILADYKFAYETLQDRAQVQGRANKWTAAGFLAKAHTYLASAKNSGLNGFIDINSFDWVDSDQHYREALTYTQAIVSNSGYVLIPRYDYLFRESTKQHQYQETLLAAEASTSATRDAIHLLANTFLPQGNQNVTGGGFGWFRPTDELHKKYVVGDFRRDHNLTGNLNSVNNFEMIEGVKYFVPRTLPNTNQGYYSIGKYRMIDPALKLLPKWASTMNLPILRFADVLLMHAEAQYFTGNEAGARTTLSTIRQRAVTAGTTVTALNDAYRKADFVDELLEERSRELCFENWRRIDLARFNKFDETINGLSTTLGFYNRVTVPIIQTNWRPERVWFPIPIIQIDLNKNLVPNQGY